MPVFELMARRIYKYNGNATKLLQSILLNALRAAYLASEGSASLAVDLLQNPDLRDVELDKMLQVYRRGFVTALGVICLAFGLDEADRRELGRTGRPRFEPHLPPALHGDRTEDPGIRSPAQPAFDEFDLVGVLWAKKRQK